MPNKILLASTNQSIFTEPSIKYLTKMGYEVSFFDLWNNPIWNNNFLVKLTNQFPKLKIKLIQNAEVKIGQKLLKIVKQSKPDFLLVLKGKSLLPNVIKEISTLGTKTINWFPDATTNWNSIELLSTVYDYFFVYDPYILKLLQNIGRTNCYYLPFVADMDKEAEFKLRSDYKYDVTFIGSYEPGLYDARVQYLSELKDLDLHIWGNQNWKKTSLAKFHHGWMAEDEMLDIYQKSKIVINIDQQIEVEEGLNLRPFEVTAAGSFLLNDPIKDDIFRLFEDGKEIVVFHDVKDLREKVEYYLEHEAEREKIVKAGFERSKREHTYEDRFKKMFEIINQ